MSAYQEPLAAAGLPLEFILSRHTRGICGRVIEAALPVGAARHPRPPFDDRGSL